MTTIQEKKVELLREKNIKSLGCSNKAAGFELRDFTAETEQVPANNVTHLKKAYSDDLREPTIGSLSVGDKPVDESQPTIIKVRESDFLLPNSSHNGTIGEIPSLPSTDWLNERHCQDTETIYKLRSDLKAAEKERYTEIERGDTWRNKYIAADNELSKAKVKHDAEVRNLQYEITLLNKALEAHAGDEQLLLLTMKKAVSFAERVKVE